MISVQSTVLYVRLGAQCEYHPSPIRDSTFGFWIAGPITMANLQHCLISESETSGKSGIKEIQSSPVEISV
jgi:hypothetical protein